MSPYWIVTLIVGLAFLGLVAYPLARSRLGARSVGGGTGGRGGGLGSTEVLVEVEGVRDFALLTSEGDLVAMLEIHPFVVTTSVPAAAVGEMFGQAIRNMPDGETWQIVQIPGTQSIEAYTDRLARLAHSWAELLMEVQDSDSEGTAYREHLQRRLSLPATLGALLLEQSNTADLALRRTFVVLTHISVVPSVFVLIFKHAFTPYAAAGGAIGYTVKSALQFGFRRGLLTNEAGLGSAPIAHAAAQTKSSVHQGLLGIGEVFVDTIVVCSFTAIINLSTGLWDKGFNGTQLTAESFKSVAGFLGSGTVALASFLFGYTTLIGWYY